MLDGGLLAKAALALIYGLLCTTCAHSVTIDMVVIGHAGNALDTRYDATGVGAVGYAYQIDKADRQRIQVGNQRNPRTPRQASRNSGGAR